MIKKSLMLLLLLSVTLFAQNNFSPLQTKIVALQDDYLLIEDIPDVQIGTTGIVLHSFDATHKTIITTVVVSKKSEGKIFLKPIPFKDIQQEVLPSYDIAPKVGDVVILNFLYTRAMAITPNEKVYHFITKHYPKFEWLHPDIFAANLAASYTPKPTKETFQSLCLEENIGVLLFAIEDKATFVDCKTFAPLKRVDIPKIEQIQTPFYSRIDNIKGRVFGLLGGKGIKDYNSYYHKMLGKQ